MDIVHVAAWIVVIFFGFAFLQACLGEPLLTYVILGTISLGIIGFMAVVAVAFWDPAGRFLTIVLGGGTLLSVIFYYIGQLAKAVLRLLRNRFTGSGSPNSGYLHQ